ncbi:MAG: hypothetical protein R3E39_07915 [Anaerolineae bacterium]
MAKSRKSSHKPTRFRLRFTFWLDMHKSDEHELAETIDDLKTRKLFAKSVRDGITLVVSLMEGRLDVLFSMYPWVREEFEKRAGMRSAEALEAQLNRIEQLMGQGITLPVDMKVQPSGAGPKPLKAPSFALPRFDDDDELDTLIINKSTSTNAALNFVNNMKNLQQ